MPKRSRRWGLQGVESKTGFAPLGLSLPTDGPYRPPARPRPRPEPQDTRPRQVIHYSVHPTQIIRQTVQRQPTPNDPFGLGLGGYQGFASYTATAKPSSKLVQMLEPWQEAALADKTPLPEGVTDLQSLARYLRGDAGERRVVPGEIPGQANVQSLHESKPARASTPNIHS
jgi:hypothetical protein